MSHLPLLFPCAVFQIEACWSEALSYVGLSVQCYAHRWWQYINKYDEPLNPHEVFPSDFVISQARNPVHPSTLFLVCRLFKERLTQIKAKLEDVISGKAAEYLEPLGVLQNHMQIRIEVAGEPGNLFVGVDGAV